MPKGSEALTQARREEIVDACERLYARMSFKEVTIKEIGKETSFTRTSIYNYFQTKEEIFLALIEREFRRWNMALAEALAEKSLRSRAEVAEILAATLAARPQLLKILSMNMFEIEANSRLERLVDFKRAFFASLMLVDKLLEKLAPPLDETARQAFVYAFFPFMYGIYPYTAVTDKQREAVRAVGGHFIYYTPHDLILQTVHQLLAIAQ